MTAFRFVLVALLLIGVGALQAQTPPPRPVGPAVWIPPQPGQQPIRLDEVSIQIQTAGFIARTRIELSFHNPNARVLEGEFVFPLAAGQTVSGYALEVEGRMREGVVVPKQTARVAFEDISRQQIDPGLAELTKGNVFRTRLYPIPARGNKRVALSFEQIMPLEGGQYRYLLPLAFQQSVARFSVRAEAALGAAGGTVASPDPALRFDRSGQAWIAGFTREGVQPQRELAFAIPRGAGDAEQLEAADALEPAWRSVLAQIDSGRPATLKALPAPRRIALFVDASGSAAQRDLARERAVLQRYLAGLGEVEVALLAFRDAAEAPRRFRLRRGDVGALMEAIAALPLDGGSSYGAVDLSVVPDADLMLVLGDGLSNFAAADPKLGTGAPRLFVLHAAQQADHAALERIARRAGGRVLDLLQLDADAALAALTRPEWRLLSTEVLAGRCEQLLPQAPLAVEARHLLSARCEGRARLRLRFGQAGQGEVVRELQVGADDAVDAALGETVHRLHAQARIAELERAAKPDADAIAALGTQYGVVTRHTSLLVLDRIEDYLRYRIEPKEDDLRAQYRARLPDWPKPVAVDEGKAQRIATLSALWRGFRDWHRTRHPWLETLLLPAVEAEAGEWRRFAPGQDAAGKRVAAAQRRIDELQAQARALQARWPSEGADATSRARWEREATAVMLAVDDLRGERSGLPAVAAVAMDREERDGADAPLRRVEVTGSVARDDLAQDAAPSEMAVPAPPPPPATAPAPMAEVSAQAAPRGVGSNEAAKREGEADAAPPVRARISLRGWNPDTPYLAAIRAAADPYRAYLEQRAEHGDSPAFFLDCADHFRDALKDPVLALRILSNIAELGSENTALTRVLGYRLAQWQRFDLAVGQFEDALVQRPEEPQSHRDLALALARQAQPDVARAVELLWTVASGDWHGRFPEIELIALHELNDLLARGGVDAAALVAELGIPGELIDPLRVGLRVSMTWDADNTDIDLWVIDPTGESTYYGQNRSRAGGHVSRDFTQGYGPEVYTIARPLPGTYRVRAHYFGDRRQSLTGPVTVQVEFQTGFGSGQDARESITRRLESGREWIDLGEFRVEAAPGA